MVKKPNFKIEAKGKDITEKIRKNLIVLSFDDKEADESDEISFTLKGLYSKPIFGDDLKLWLGWDDNLYLCGTFSVNLVSKDYKNLSTEIRATAVNFASNQQKEKKRRTWENTSLFEIARKIANENSLKIKTTSEDMQIVSKLQDNVGDVEFLYGLAFEFGYLMAIKNDTIILSIKDKLGKETTSLTPKNESLPIFKLQIEELEALNITDSNRNSYDNVILEWQDIEAGKLKSIQVGSGNNSYKMQIAQPKTDAEAFKKGEAKLNELQKGGINGKCSLLGANIIAGGKLKFMGVDELRESEFSIKQVSHSLTTSSYSIDIHFEG
ncbi:phage tail protein [Aliarcobacter skirrowii]|uniref:phage late control D family protein n=1 Tax=Aliarcobacter skirrowii TaxID=28200 RepID=UPI00100B7A01|nr:phage tail protein [Aliarcobacter skirrowii]RXJ80821.1 phage tail protein [Aliarcobacter skirrowii]